MTAEGMDLRDQECADITICGGWCDIHSVFTQAQVSFLLSKIRAGDGVDILDAIQFVVREVIAISNSVDGQPKRSPVQARATFHGPEARSWDEGFERGWRSGSDAFINALVNAENPYE